jgi:hypothetical protein
MLQDLSLLLDCYVPGLLTDEAILNTEEPGADGANLATLLIKLFEGFPSEVNALLSYELSYYPGP